MHKEIFYKIENDKEQQEPKILNLGDLDFGFFIWLPFIGVAIIVFFMELITFKIQKKKNDKKFVKVKFAKVHPMMIEINQTKLRENSCKIKVNIFKIFKLKTKSEIETRKESSYEFLFGSAVSHKISCTEKVNSEVKSRIIISKEILEIKSEVVTNKFKNNENQHKLKLKKSKERVGFRKFFGSKVSKRNSTNEHQLKSDSKNKLNNVNFDEVSEVLNSNKRNTGIKENFKDKISSVDQQ
ncbi:hypothetical protein PVAND_012574 [Polypedilum vanderplanki]|nr:hypothetical protein PVAND_012574 [Polypedilum vanderplanki]